MTAGSYTVFTVVNIQPTAAPGSRGERSFRCVKMLAWWQDARSELGMALADDAYGESDALVEGLAGDSMRADDVAEFVLWVTLRGWGDSFV